MRAARELLTRAMQPLTVGLPVRAKDQFEWHLKSRGNIYHRPGLYLENLPRPMIKPVYAVLARGGVPLGLCDNERSLQVLQISLPRHGLNPNLVSVVQKYADSDEYLSPLSYRPDIAEKIEKLNEILDYHDKRGFYYQSWRVRTTLGGLGELNFRLSIGRSKDSGFDRRAHSLSSFYRACGIIPQVMGKYGNGFLVVYGRKNVANIMVALPGPQLYALSPAQGPQKLLTHSRA